MPLMKRHEDIWSSLARKLGANNKTLDTFSRRLESEGSHFITTWMPELHKVLLSSLECGYWQPPVHLSTGKGGILPAFMNEFFSKIFHNDGWIRSNPRMLSETRQLLVLFYKFEDTPSSVTDEESIIKFKERDANVKQGDWPDTLSAVKKHIWSIMPDDPYDIRPHHSSGATADSESASTRREFKRHIPSLHSVFPLGDYFYNGPYDLLDAISSHAFTRIEPKAKLTLVPKDARGQRVICMEPHERMFVQKGLMQLLYDHIEKYCPLTRGFINFTDQEINRSLAYSSSINRKYATIDMKDASDMVSWNLIKELMPPDWVDVLTATRSSIVSTALGDVNLNKFAPMGSALCFPIEAILFWSIARTVTDHVWVYGDDIIVPVEHSSDVKKALESYGLLVNYNKSYDTGFFRESCGGDYYKGHECAPIYLRSYTFVRYIAFCNLITERYGSEVSEDLVKLHENKCNKPVFREPLSRAAEPKYGVFYTPYSISSRVFFKHRWNKDLQREEVRYLQPSQAGQNTKKGQVSRSDAMYFDMLIQQNPFTRPLLDSHHDALTREVTYESGLRFLPESFDALDVATVRPLIGSARDKVSHLKYLWSPINWTV